MLVTLDEMKTYLGIALINTTYDAFLTQQIELISQTIEAYCRRNFASASYVQTFYKEEIIKNEIVLDTLHLWQFPLISVTSVKEIDNDNNETLITDYRENKSLAWLIKSRYTHFFQNGDKIEVAYTSGFATIPAPIQNAVYSLVQERYNKKINGIDLNFGSDVQSISIPGTISVAYDYSLQDNERKTAFGSILGKYVNSLDYYRSERVITGRSELIYI